MGSREQLRDENRNHRSLETFLGSLCPPKRSKKFSKKMKTLLKIMEMLIICDII
ncbi:MAG: hypothetical protein GX275_05450 [Clostridiales bacterium]|nr:hypothetical protein [Clostridiales bacterium]